MKLPTREMILLFGALLAFAALIYPPYLLEVKASPPTGKLVSSVGETSVGGHQHQSTIVRSWVFDPPSPSYFYKTVRIYYEQILIELAATGFLVFILVVSLKITDNYQQNRLNRKN